MDDGLDSRPLHNIATGCSNPMPIFADVSNEF